MEQIEGFHARPGGGILMDQNKARKMIGLLAGALLLCVPAYSQRPSQESAAQGSGVGIPPRAPSRSPDIISHNLDRVAAASVQILAVLHREPGVIVGLKRLLAQDARASVRSLDESHLTYFS